MQVRQAEYISRCYDTYNFPREDIVLRVMSSTRSFEDERLGEVADMACERV